MPSGLGTGSLSLRALPLDGSSHPPQAAVGSKTWLLLLPHLEPTGRCPGPRNQVTALPWPPWQRASALSGLAWFPSLGTLLWSLVWGSAWWPLPPQLSAFSHVIWDDLGEVWAGSWPQWGGPAQECPGPGQPASLGPAGPAGQRRRTRNTSRHRKGHRLPARARGLRSEQGRASAGRRPGQGCLPAPSRSPSSCSLGTW